MPRKLRSIQSATICPLVFLRRSISRRPVYLFATAAYDGLSQEETAMLTPEELEKLSGAESLFPSPIPVQFVSSDEYMPQPQSAQQKEFEARVKDIGARMAKKNGISRRKFFKTAGGMAAAFAAMNQVHAKGGQPIYEVLTGEAASLDVAQARADNLKDLFERDRQP